MLPPDFNDLIRGFTLVSLSGHRRQLTPTNTSDRQNISEQAPAQFAKDLESSQQPPSHGHGWLAFINGPTRQRLMHDALTHGPVELNGLELMSNTQLLSHSLQDLAFHPRFPVQLSDTRLCLVNPWRRPPSFPLPLAELPTLSISFPPSSSLSYGSSYSPLSSGEWHTRAHAP